MPDKYGFDHLPNWGVVSHRCIEEGCEWPGHGVVVSEADRKRHYQMHQRPAKAEARKREQALKKQRLANLAKARKVREENRQEGAA